MSRTTERNNQIRDGAVCRLTQLGLSRQTAQAIVARMPLMEVVVLVRELDAVLSDPADDAANLAAEGT